MIPGVDELALRQRQYLVHSFLYYQLDETIITDTQFDEIWKDLKRLYEEDFISAQFSPYNDIIGIIVEQETSSGAFIEKYPPEVVTTALRLIWQERYQHEPFEGFIGRWGYNLA